MSRRSYNERKNDRETHYGGLAELPPDQEAIEAFRCPAYQVPHRRVHRMTLAEAIEYIRVLVCDYGYMMSDPIPQELVDRLNGQHEEVTEYLVRKCGIGGDAGGQATAETVPGTTERAETE